MLQVVGEKNAVKNAMSLISSRLRESQHRDRSNFHGRLHSPERFFPDDDYIPYANNASRRPSMDGAGFGSRLSFSSYRSNNYAPRSSGFTTEAGLVPMREDAQPVDCEDIVFRILCPVDRINSIVGESDGIVDLLQNEIGVDIKVADPVAGSNEQIIIISSDEVIPAVFMKIKMT